PTRGHGSCGLIWLLTVRLSSNRGLSLVTTAIAALNPYHISYSSSAMTDVPHVFFLLLSAYCCMRHRWLLASVAALAAGLIRMESWTVIPLIPVAQVLSQAAERSDVIPETKQVRSVWTRVLTSAAL